MHIKYRLVILIVVIYMSKMPYFYAMLRKIGSKSKEMLVWAFDEHSFCVCVSGTHVSISFECLFYMLSVQGDE